MPLVSFLSVSTKAILRILRIKLGSVDPVKDPIKEILGITKLAAIKNRIDKEQEKIIENTMKIQQIIVGAIMIKNEEMKILSADMSLNEALIEAHIHHHTRFPLVEKDNPAKILGYVNFKDIINMLRINPASSTLMGICRPILSVYDTEIVTAVLRTLIREHQHIAIVKNSREIPVGLITLEDILETIVGDISDEYDIMPEYLYNITPSRFMAGGGVKMSRLREVISPALPDDGRTLNEWLSETLKQPIKVEKTFKYGDISFFIRKMRRTKVYEAIIDNSSGK
jgi:putative hemolysin